MQEGFCNLHHAGPLSWASGPVAVISTLRSAGPETVTREMLLFVYHSQNIFVLHIQQKYWNINTCFAHAWKWNIMRSSKYATRQDRSVWSIFQYATIMINVPQDSPIYARHCPSRNSCREGGQENRPLSDDENNPSPNPAAGFQLYLTFY
jgi:hypothetical protein